MNNCHAIKWSFSIFIFVFLTGCASIEDQPTTYSTKLINQTDVDLAVGYTANNDDGYSRESLLAHAEIVRETGKWITVYNGFQTYQFSISCSSTCFLVIDSSKLSLQ
jgi:hypothetical protein